MKIVNQYNEGELLPIMSLSEALECSPLLDKLDPRGVLFHQSLSDNLSLYEESCTSMSNYVSFSEYNFEDKMRVMFQEDLVSSVLIHGTIRSRKLVIPFGNYPSGGYHHYDMSIKEDRFVDRYANKILKGSVTTNFRSDVLREYAYNYIQQRVESREKEKSPHSHDIAVSAEYLVFDESGKTKVEPVEWLCYLENGNLSCEYVSHNGRLHPMDDAVIENGLMEAFDHGFTITAL